MAKAKIIKEYVEEGQKFIVIEAKGVKRTLRPRSFAGNGKAVFHDHGFAVLHPSLEIVSIEDAKQVGPGKYVADASKLKGTAKKKTRKGKAA